MKKAIPGLWGDRVIAMLYEPVSPGAEGKGSTFSSPHRSIHFDRVEDVSSSKMIPSGGRQMPMRLALLNENKWLLQIPPDGTRGRSPSRAGTGAFRGYGRRASSRAA